MTVDKIAHYFSKTTKTESLVWVRISIYWKSETNFNHPHVYLAGETKQRISDKNIVLF